MLKKVTVFYACMCVCVCQREKEKKKNRQIKKFDSCKGGMMLNSEIGIDREQWMFM